MSMKYISRTAEVCSEPIRLHRLERTNLDKPSATNSTSSSAPSRPQPKNSRARSIIYLGILTFVLLAFMFPALRGATSEQLRRPILSVSLERVQAPWVVFQFKYRSDTNLSFQPLRFARSKADQPEEILCVESLHWIGAPWLGAMQPAQYFPGKLIPYLSSDYWHGTDFLKVVLLLLAGNGTFMLLRSLGIGREGALFRR